MDQLINQIPLKSFETCFSDKTEQTSYFIFYKLLDFIPISLIGGTSMLDQDWKWVTHNRPRNVNPFLHHTFLHKNSTNQDTADFLFLSANKRTSLFTSTIVFHDSPPNVSFAEMTHPQGFVYLLTHTISTFQQPHPFHTVWEHNALFCVSVASFKIVQYALCGGTSGDT